MTAATKAWIVRKLIVDERNELFDAQAMKSLKFPSELKRVREFAERLLAECPDEFREGNLLEQQVSELLKNAIKHGNLGRDDRSVHVWYDFRKRVRLIVEDEGDGFVGLDAWNEFYFKRQVALYEKDFDTFLELARYQGPTSDESDGGNSLIAALEYWNGGMIYNARKNKIGVVRWYSSRS